MFGIIALLAKLHPANWLFQAQPADDEESKHAVVNLLRELIPKCPQCGSEINGHTYCLAASCMVDEQSVPMAQAFLDAIDSQNWAPAFEHQGWEVMEDDLELYVITCPDGKRTAAVVFSPFRFELREYVMRLAPIPDDADVAAFLQTRQWSPC